MTKKVIALFDLDGTLSEPRLQMTEAMTEKLSKLKSKVAIAVVSGSDYSKLQEQLGPAAGGIFNYLFAENGAIAYNDGQLIHSRSFVESIGESYLKSLINFVLGYFSKLEIPVKRGNFIEYRSSMMNFSPIGRNCSYKERLEFYKYDIKHGIRKDFVNALENHFGDKLQFSIGGQISVDCFPKGQDKRYCLQFISSEYDEIHFFGDKTYPGGNDHEIYEDLRTIGHSVTGPQETAEIVEKLFLK